MGANNSSKIITYSGVSGGTIAFISGIYEELIETIHKLDLGFFKIWKTNGVKSAWQQYNLAFLLALFSGVIISLLSLSTLIKWLLKTEPISLWSFFFGLIIASILLVGKQISKWNLRSVFALVLAAILSFYITILEPIGTADSTWFLFFAGFIAIIAMILPGLSGAFILLLLGAYQSIISTLSQFKEGMFALDWQLFSSALVKLIVFGLGAIVGLKAFSGLLNWMFKHYKNTVLAVLTGFMIGALNKIWPWKEVLQYRLNHSGEKVPFLEKSVFPGNYEGDSQILYALIFAILGFLSIYILERIATMKKTN